MNIFKNLFRFRNPFKTPKIYNNNGTPSSDAQLDQYRGMHSGRDAEQLTFALNLKRKRLNNPAHEWFPLGSPSGAEPKVDALIEPSELQVKNLLWGRGGMYYTGRVKTYEWESNKKTLFQCVAETVYWDRSDKTFVHGWQGPQPGTNYYGSDKRMWIEGPEPVIKGRFYEKSK
jgi:hypothetical protein